MFPIGFSSFDDDPFFSGHRERMRGLSDFGMPMLSVTDHFNDGKRRSNRQSQAVQRSGDIFSDMMGRMQQMMDDMGGGGMRTNVRSDGANGHSFVQSSVYSYRNTGEGQPDIYEAHHSNRYGPGGIREERKAMRDTSKNLEKMAVGRHIGGRGHVVERSRDTRNDDLREHQDLIGLTEDEVEGYKREWHDRTKDWSTNSRGIGNYQERRNELGHGQPRATRQQQALEYKAAPEKERKSKRNKPSKY